MTAPEHQATHPEPGSRAEFKTYEIRRKDNKVIAKSVPDPFGKHEERDRDEAYALVIHRDYTDKEPSVKLRINSPHLLQAFRDVIKHYPSVAAAFNSPFELKGPFQMLMHYWDDLEAYRSMTSSMVMRRDLNLLFDFMEHELGPAREALLTMVQNGQVTYFTAWALFRPGDLLYRREFGHEWLLRYYDGKSVGQAKQMFVVVQKEVFGQENPAYILDLPVYPRIFVKQDSALEETLQVRGMKYLELQGTLVKLYDGLATYLHEPPGSFWHPNMASFGGVWRPYTETGRVVLDHKTFQEDNYKDSAKVTRADPDPLLCPPYAIGYSLGKKYWSRFFVDNIHDVDWRKDAWQSLVLEVERKEIIQALVTSHRYPEDVRNQTEQKGKGLVILLHGSPGSGKTLTAETAAECTERALLSASLSDLNQSDDPWSFESELKKLLQYATLWKAVVLLDEADVFLEAREDDSSNIQRNALVAVFLKELEYFSGIVFLTTNRLASFDHAMKSRIHLALSYDAPGRDLRRQLWRQALSNVPSEEMSSSDDLDEVATNLASRPLNGREIYNTLNTARTIARFKKTKLQLGHIESVLNVKSDFESRLQSVKKRMMRTGQHEMSLIGISRKNSILAAEPDAIEQ
ncbi:hypothetical protein E8E14_014456 [Neopestalotiopsis sp. 37M]|nr:hypothetical protein E8E14_014456 [Neopestalotiopsis sp. 37M]